VVAALALSEYRNMAGGGVYFRKSEEIFSQQLNTYNISSRGALQAHLGRGRAAKLPFTVFETVGREDSATTYALSEAMEL
jgi:hypothetical protein